MTKLKDLTRLNGITLKDLAIKTKIKYTTLVSMSNRPISHWNEKNKILIADALCMKINDLDNNLNCALLSPFIKWVGGKRQLLPQLIAFLPEEKYNTYYEPFIGGGALFLRLAPRKAIINDSNKELYNTWNVVKNNLPDISLLLKKHECNDSKQYYLDIRSVDRNGKITQMSDVERAARFIYMNKAGFNGLWRVNSKGQNNVPYGDHKKLNLLSESLSSVSSYLNKTDIKIQNKDYRESVKTAKSGDFVYFDPPYLPVNPTSSFTNYTEKGFGLIQQEQLRNTALDLAYRGVKVMLSNSDVPLIEELYSENIFKIHHVSANRFINSNSSKRGKVGEVIITTY